MILTATQIGHLGRYFKQKVELPNFAIIGGYHGGNLGDMALGRAVSEVLNGRGIKNGLQTIYNLEKWPKTPFAIVGGGAVGYSDSLDKVYDRYKANFSKLGFLGVDFNEPTYADNILEMLSKAAFVSCRSEMQAEKIKAISGRKNIYSHPDIAFSLLPEHCEQARNFNLKRQKKIYVNIVPLYGSIKDGNIIPNLNYKNERPELYEDFNSMHSNYQISVRESLQKAIGDGYKIEFLAFTPQDLEYGKIVLKGLNVEFLPYHSDPYKMLKIVSTGEGFICTRYHATIFGIKAGVKIQPIAYAKKNELMLMELGINSNDYISTTDLAKGENILPEGFICDDDVVVKWELESKKMIQLCINSLLGDSDSSVVL